MAPENGRYWRAFRALFLHTHAYEVPAEHRDVGQYAEWEQRLAPRADEYVDLVRQIHATTAYEDDAEEASPVVVISPEEYVTPLVNRDEIAAAYSQLRDRLIQGSRPISRPAGWQGGGGDFTVHWRPGEQIWAILDADFAGNRYWCAFGTQDPTLASGLTLVCEINPPVEGVNRRCAGLFVRDADGRIYLTHSGRVGGGRKGIGKQRFRAFLSDGDVRWVRWPDGAESDVIVVGQVGEEDLPTRVARFVHAVEQFKQSAVQGDDE
jgi:hypothetical protein